MKKLLAIAIVLLLSLSLIPQALAEESEVSLGKSYTLVTPASSGYADDGKKLTDGIYGTVPDGSTNYYSSGAYVGFNQSAVDENGNFVIILDLGEIYDDLSGFTIGFLNETSVGIFAPKSVNFALSDTEDGVFEDVGTLTTEKSKSDGISETHSMTLAVENASGRYLRVSVKHLGEYTDDSGATKSAGWTFIDEISVYSSGSANGSTSESENDSTLPSESSDMSSESSVSDSPVVPGDDNASPFVFALLAISSLTMAAALFIVKKRESY